MGRRRELPLLSFSRLLAGDWVRTVEFADDGLGDGHTKVDP